jgi:hypothetical protein
MAAPIAIIVKRERDLVEEFEREGAVSAETARPIHPESPGEHLAWNRLRSRAVIREAAPGRYYVDRLTWIALRRSRRRLAAVIFVILAIATIAILTIQGRK